MAGKRICYATVRATGFPKSLSCCGFRDGCPDTCWCMLNLTSVNGSATTGVWSESEQRKNAPSALDVLLHSGEGLSQFHARMAQISDH